MTSAEPKPGTPETLHRHAVEQVLATWGWLEDRPAAVLRPSDLRWGIEAADAPVFDVVTGGSDPVTFEVRPAGGSADRDELVCRRDGRLVTYTDLSGLGPSRGTASASEWFGWIAGRLADRAAHSDTWGGEDLDSALRRSERDIVAFDRQATLVATHADAASLETWVGQVLSECPRRATVRALSAQELRDIAAELPVENHHWELDAPATSESTGTSLRRGDGLIQVGGAFEPALAAFVDGSQLTAYDTVSTVPVTALSSLKSRSGPGEWYALVLPEVPGAMVFPADCVLDVETDGDGSRIRLNTAPVERRRRELTASARFRIEWGAWLPEFVDVDDAVLTAEIARAEADLSALAEENVR